MKKHKPKPPPRPACRIQELPPAERALIESFIKGLSMSMAVSQGESFPKVEAMELAAEFEQALDSGHFRMFDVPDPGDESAVQFEIWDGTAGKYLRDPAAVEKMFEKLYDAERLKEVHGD